MATEADAIVKEYQGLVRSIALKLRSQFDLNCDLDDLIAFGNQGLLEAMSRFDPTRGVQMNTFAYYRIRGAVLDGVRRMAYLPRRIHHKVREAEALDLVSEPIGDARAATPEAKADLEATAQALDDAKALFAPRVVHSCVQRETGIELPRQLRHDRLRGLARAQQIAANQVLRELARDALAQAARLLQPHVVERNVHVPLETQFAVPVGFAMADQDQFGHSVISGAVS